MKKIAVLIAVLLGSIGVSYAAKTGQSLDQMVAIVNDELITRSELNNEIQAAKMQITQQGNINVSDKSLEQQVLQQLINKKLQLQTAAQAGLTVTEAEVDETIKRIAAQNNVSVDELYKHLEQTGMTVASYRHEIHDQVIVQRLQQHEVAGKVSVTPEEITAFMKANPAKSSGISEYRLQDILIPLSDSPSTAELAAAKTRANNILSKLQGGTPYAVVSKQEKSLQETDLGWRAVAELPSAFADEVGKMKKDGFAGPIQTGNGLHILRMADVRTLQDPNAPPSDRKSIESLLLQKKFEVAVQNWMSRLRSAAFISTTA